MPDVFFSYSSRDKLRVQKIVEAFERQGHSIFWDQTLPPGENWDKWIRGHIERARAVIVLWSRHSIESDNVQQEARIAHTQSKLIPALLDAIPSEKIPLGLAVVQCARLIQWNGEPDHDGWLQLLRTTDDRIIPPYARFRLEVAESTVSEVRRRALVSAETAAINERTLAREIEASRVTIADLKLACDAKDIEIERLSQSSIGIGVDDRRIQAQLETAQQTTTLWHSSYIRLKEEAERAETERAEIQGHLGKAMADRASLELHAQRLTAQVSNLTSREPELRREIEAGIIRETIPVAQRRMKMRIVVVASVVSLTAFAAASLFSAANYYSRAVEFLNVAHQLDEKHKAELAAVESRVVHERTRRTTAEEWVAMETKRRQDSKTKITQLEQEISRLENEVREAQNKTAADPKLKEADRNTVERLRVEIAKSQNEALPAPQPTSPGLTTGEYVAMLGSYGDPKNACQAYDEATQRQRQTESAVVGAEIRRVLVKGEIRYRVLATPPETRQAADNRCRLFDSAGIKCSVVSAAGEPVRC